MGHAATTFLGLKWLTTWPSGEDGGLIVSLSSGVMMSGMMKLVAK